jgi:hypothetical protein
MVPKMNSTQLDTEYSVLMELLFHVVDSRAGQKITDETRWLYETEVLAVKLFNHLATIRHLWNGTSLPMIDGRPRQFTDHASVSVLIRAAFETYLTYYHIYGDTKSSADTRKLRHDVWQLRGLLDRQGFRIISKEKAPILAQEKELIAGIISGIQANPVFKSLGAKQQAKAKKGDWRLNQRWSDLAEKAGFHRQVFEDVYTYLCAYAHSGGLSALQIGKAISQEDQRRLTVHSKYYGILLMSHFIMSYTELFPDTKSLLDINADAAELARRRALTWNEPEFRKHFER